jgi:hypothetical protein
MVNNEKESKNVALFQLFREKDKYAIANLVNGLYIYFFELAIARSFIYTEQ